ncbi:DUF4249 domain-containing protein [Nonlabens ulvanivorans]|uniref:DUF4249 domain-containing protein n=1 Tax=Nonlabens ulvanivorans TaxID=906888 RepID=UPI0029439A57|nr:DUF4249 domain-containing protein [Nonlabens ulvanivorans]WOI21502.1 DUF4249 domain-containing protein [Nonlabens ulvanivorans]
MKKIFTLLVVSICIISCEDVIELDLNNAAPRLVIDAALELQEDGFTEATVLLTRSSAFYQEEILFVDDASVIVTDPSGTDHTFILTNPGLYKNVTLNIQDGESYVLTVIDGDDIYTATQEFISTVPYSRVEQSEITGFGDFTEITGYFNDPPGEENYYLFEYIDAYNTEVDISDDEFSDGNEALTAFFMEDLPTGTIITLTIKGIDRRGFTFYDTLIQQTADGGGGPFDTQPATVRGNIINTVNPENFPYGYFRVSEKFEIEYTVVENP